MSISNKYRINKNQIGITEIKYIYDFSLKQKSCFVNYLTRI